MSISLLSEWSQDLGAQFPRRLTKKQKTGFLKAIGAELQTRNFETEQTTIRLWGIPNRLLTTKCENPSVIFLAHYDTPTIMPYGFSLIYKLFGHTRQGISAVITIILMIALFTFHSWLAQVESGFWATVYLILVFILFVIPFFIPNPRNAEDNTSGVLGLLAIADWIKDKAFKDDVQFVFLDNEEWGLIGSNALKRHWGKLGHLHSNTTIINLDCISRGGKPLIVHHKNDRIAQEVLPYLQKYLPQTEIFDMKNFPLSDNYTFRNQGAIDISYADPSVTPGGYYIPGVHSPKDKDFSPEKTMLLIDGLTDYLQAKL
jgi:hypothetical protein